jgi:type 1 glutamine amidotransferase
MRARLASLVACSIVVAACGDGSQSVAPDAGSVPTHGSAGSGGTPAGSGSSGGPSSSGASGSSSGGDDASVDGGSSDANGGDGGTVPPDPYSGPFKILVLSKTLGFHHDSIPAGQQLLRDLGKCVDAASCALTHDVAIDGAKPDSSFTVDVAGAPTNCPAATPSNYTAYGTMGCDGSTTDLSQFTADNLKNYQMLFFVSPTGTVFSSGGDNGKAGMAAIQTFIEGGGAYGGVHAASDFEDSGGFPWYYNELMGAHFTDHNGDGTAGTLTTPSAYATHPVMRGLPSPWSTEDEWYLENREISAQPGFQILETLSGVPPLGSEPASDVRPMIWIKQFPVATDVTREGRMFYTCRGHNIARYGEASFRQLVHQGILWATHRLM